MKKMFSLCCLILWGYTPVVCFSQVLNRDSISFLHSHGMIDEEKPLSILLANELYKISVKAKNEKNPLFYGGSYIKSDSIVLLLANTTPFTNILSITTNTSLPYLYIEPCTYSYRELLATNEVLNEIFFKKSNRALIDNRIGWSSWHLSIHDNRILIRLKDCTEKNIKLFKEYVLDSPMLIFIEADKYISY